MGCHRRIVVAAFADAVDGEDLGEVRVGVFEDLYTCVVVVVVVVIVVAVAAAAIFAVVSFAVV